MELAALNRMLDGGDARSALARALALLPEQSGAARLQLLLFVARCHGVVGVDATLKSDAERQEAYGRLLPELEALIRDATAEGCHRIALLARANYGTVLVRAARYAEGIEYLEAVAGDLAAAGLKGDMGAAKGSIGTAWLKLGQYQRAIDVFRESLDLLGAGSIAFQRDVWDGIAAAHEGLDQPREALAALKSARAGAEAHDRPALDPGLAVTLSIGLASSAEAAGGGAGALLALADARVYAAKAGGRNRVVASSR